MRIWFTSQYRAVTVSVVGVCLTMLALLVVIGVQGLSERTTAASLLVLSFMVFAIGGVLFTGRAFLNWQINNMTTHLIWERGFVIAAVLATVLGLVLLEDMLHSAGDTFLARLGLVTYFCGAVVVVVSETASVNKQEWNYAQIVFYVVLAFLAQAAFGEALLTTGLVATWVAWATIIWNLGCLLIMLIFSRRNIYYPALHHVAPLLIGIALVTAGWH